MYTEQGGTAACTPLVSATLPSLRVTQMTQVLKGNLLLRQRGGLLAPPARMSGSPGCLEDAEAWGPQ